MCVIIEASASGRLHTCAKGEARLDANVDRVDVFGVEPTRDDPQLVGDAGGLVARTDAVYPIRVCQVCDLVLHFIQLQGSCGYLQA